MVIKANLKKKMCVIKFKIDFYYFHGYFYKNHIQINMKSNK